MIMQKTILITGATGFLGSHLVKELLNNPNNHVFAVLGRPEDKANVLPDNDHLEVIECDAFWNTDLKDIDTVVNCAFARSNDYGMLSSSLQYTSRLINFLRCSDVHSAINISSQGVYKRLPMGELASENSSIEPIDTYSLAKYATEQMFLASGIPFVTNVRMASINMKQRFLNFFVQKVKSNEDIIITTPQKPAALIDIHDAASGLAAVTNLPAEKRANTYNLGVGFQMTILDYAKEVIRIGEEEGYQSKLIIEDNGNIGGAGMDCSKITNDCNWSIQISATQMINELFK